MPNKAMETDAKRSRGSSPGRSVEQAFVIVTAGGCACRQFQFTS